MLIYLVGQRIVFLVHSSDHEQLLTNKCYLRLPLRMAYNNNARVATLAPLALLASYELAVKSFNPSTTFTKQPFLTCAVREDVRKQGGWYYPARQGIFPRMTNRPK